MSSYLCVGFGFRDHHIEPKLIERCRKNDIPVVVLAQSLTEEAKLFLKKMSGNKYLGIERAEGGSKIYCADYPGGKLMEGDLWSLEGFTKLAT